VLKVRGLPAAKRPHRVRTPPTGTDASGSLAVTGRPPVFSESMTGRRDATTTERHLLESPTDTENTDLAIAWEMLREEINLALRDRAQHLHPLLGEDDVYLMPQTLLGAIWLQFARAVANRATFRLCEAADCPRGWFEVSTAPFGLRPEARFCSAQCRHRVKKARQRQEPTPTRTRRHA
jgi:hypothetical protein